MHPHGKNGQECLGLPFQEHCQQVGGLSSLLSSAGEADSGVVFVVVGSNVGVGSQLILTISLHWKLLQKYCGDIKIFPVSCEHLAPVGRMNFFLPLN